MSLRRLTGPTLLTVLTLTGSAGAGNPIPLDTPDPKYQDYFHKVRERIKAKWVYPRHGACQQE